MTGRAKLVHVIRPGGYEVCLLLGNCAFPIMHGPAKASGALGLDPLDLIPLDLIPLPRGPGEQPVIG